MKHLIKLSRQEMLDIAVNGVNKHGFSIGESIIDCRYRLDETAECPIRCGVGHMIPDELYEPGMENMGASDLNQLWHLFDERDLDMLEEMQNVHDRAADQQDMNMFNANMAGVATRWNIVFNSPT